MRPWSGLALIVTGSVTGLAITSGAAVGATPAAFTQDAPAVRPEAPEGDVVVTGRRTSRAEALRASARYVDALEGQPLSGQIARWRDPLCIETRGVVDAANAYVTREVERIAREAGTLVATQPCRTNVLIQFTPDAKRLLASLERKNPRLLFATPMAERAALRSAELPLRWWSGVALRGRDGEALGTDPPAAIANIGELNMPTDERTAWGTSYTSSLISTKVSAETQSVVVLVDVPLTTGRKLSSIAAYAAFVTQSRISIGNEAPADSILSLFKPGYAGDGQLSVQDRRYLAALSRMPRDHQGARQRGFLVTTMADAG